MCDQRKRVTVRTISQLILLLGFALPPLDFDVMIYLLMCTSLEYIFALPPPCNEFVAMQIAMHLFCPNVMNRKNPKIGCNNTYMDILKYPS